jgi:5,10-methylenetetrahydromethanopterin reductase
MKLGAILLWGDDQAEFRGQARLAEELGYELITVGDAPFAWHDVHVSLAVVAEETQRATLSTMVTTPFMRNPVANVGAMSALHELSGGRVTFTIGTGAGVARGHGHLPVTPSALRDYVLAMKALCNGESITWDGGEVSAMRQARPFPIYISGYGPKALRVAGEVADGVVLGLGGSLAMAEENVAVVRQAAEAAGRDPESIDIWGYSFVSVRDTRAQALDDIKAFLATAAATRLRPAHRMAKVPPELRDAVLELRSRYRVDEHVMVGGHNANLVDELGLADYLASESAIAGSVEEVRQHLVELEARGVSCVIAALPGNADPEGTLRRFAEARPR